MTALPDDLVARLKELHGSRKAHPSGVHGQMCGQETWRIVASGAALESIMEAADRIATLTAENKALRSALRKWCIGRYEGGDNFAGCGKCYLCGTTWTPETAPDAHSPGCLAAGAANER